MKRRLAALAASLLVACNGVLGLDEPTLDPCAPNGCVDAALDASGPHDAGPSDAAVDRGPVNGVRCGGGAFAEQGCTGATPVCCQTNDDAGGATFGCVDNADACAGYPISCATNNDCSGTSVCCHYSSHIKCVGETTCTNDSLVCEPDGAADQCPSGWSCKAELTNDGVMSPYFACAP